MTKSGRLVLLGGCFWGLQRVISAVPGVTATWTGYAGGSSFGVAPTYYNLDVTGDSEALLVEFDPDLTDVAELTECFEDHSASDPSPASSPRYRRGILAGDTSFTRADAYHQHYYRRILGD